MGTAGVGVAHCPSSNMMIAQGLAPVAEFQTRSGPASMGARDALEIATLGGAACLGRQGELGVLRPGAVGDLVCWPLTGIPFAGALSDPVEAWLRCGPLSARHTVVGGRLVVEDGQLSDPRVDDLLRRHRVAAGRLQARH